METFSEKISTSSGSGVAGLLKKKKIEEYDYTKSQNRICADSRVLKIEGMSEPVGLMYS